MQRSKSQNELNTDGLLDSGQLKNLAVHEGKKDLIDLFKDTFIDLTLCKRLLLILTEPLRSYSPDISYRFSFHRSTSKLDRESFSLLEKFNADFDELEQVTVV